MLSRKQGHVLFIILVAGCMSCIISLAMVIVNTGVRGDLTGRWLKSWAIAFMIALPAAALLVPLLRKLADRFVSH